MSRATALDRPTAFDPRAVSELTINLETLSFYIPRE